MEKGSNSSSDRQKKAKVFFIIGYVFLVAMAFFWSLDASFVYIFLGIAIYFLFLGFYHNPSKENYQKPFQNWDTRADDGSTSFANALKAIFQKRPATARPFPKPTPAERTRRVVTVSIFAVFAVFFIFFIGSIFNSSGEWDDSTQYFQEAEQHYWAGNYDSAYLNYRKAWKLNEEYVEAMVGYGNVLAVRKQPDSAILMFDKALQIDPGYKAASYSKASTYYNQEQYNESIAILNPVLEENPDYYDAMLLVGDSYYALKQFDDAIQWYDNAYENGGARSHALCYIMGYIYDTKGNYDKAVELYKEALNYDSTVVDIYTRLGELLPNEEGNFYRAQAIQLQQQ